MDTPPLPPGFTLDASQSSLPQLPAGFKIDSPVASSSATGATEAILTNKPTQGFMQGLARSSPAMAGALAAAPEGAAMGAAAGTAVFPGVGTAVGGILGGLGAAYMGGVAGESARNAVANTVATALPKKNYPVLNTSQLLQKLNRAGQDQAWNEAFGLGIGGAIKQGGKPLAGLAEEKMPGVLKNSVGIPEPLTKYVQGRGSRNVFTPSNLNEGAALDNVGQATSDLAARRASVGKSIGNSEDFILGSGGATQELPTKDIASSLQNTMQRRGYIDPDTSDLARGKDISLLKSMLSTLSRNGTREVAPAVAEKVSPLVNEFGGKVINTPASEAITVGEGPLNLRQVINAKRLIDQHLEFGETLNREISDPAAAVAKKTNAILRLRVRQQLGSGVAKLYDDFGTISDAQEKLAEFTGTKSLSSVEQRAVQALRGIMQKNPGEVRNIVNILGSGLPGGEQQARAIFDSIAATPFTRGGIGAPSSSFIKTLTAGGLLSGPAARTAVRATEGLSSYAASPATAPRKSVSAAMAALRAMREKDKDNE